MVDYTFMRLKWLTNPTRAEMWYGDPKSVDFIKKPVEIGSKFNISILERSYCIGSETYKKGWITCKQRRMDDGESPNSALQFVSNSNSESDNDIVILSDNRNYIQCYRCSSTEYFSCRMTCMGDVCVPTTQTAKQLCTPAKTAVYLTYVGGKFKIGVSLNAPRRWVEQASDLATIVAWAPGLEARRLEQVAAQELGLRLQVRNKAKIENLSNTVDDRVMEKFTERIDQIKPITDRILKNVDGGKVIDPEIKEFSNYYGDFDISSPIQEIKPESGQEFGGTIVGIKGSILIVNQDVYYYAMDMKKLRSKTFRFLDRPGRMETQSYLDQWF